MSARWPSGMWPRCRRAIAIATFFPRSCTRSQRSPKPELESQRELAALRERNAKLGLEMARLEHELAHSRTERDRFSSVEEALTSRRDRLESELADMHRRNEATTTQLENLEQKLASLAAERDKVGLERAALASHVGELEQHLDSLQSDQKVLVSRLKEGTTSNATAVERTPSNAIAVERTPSNAIAVERALVLSIIHHESSFNPMAISRKGALGLMQLMPMTARQTADGLGLDYASRRLTEDPDYNIRLGSAYLGQLLDNFDGNYVLALAAYNAGATRVRKWLRANGDPRSPEVDAFDWIEMIPYEETRNFVQGVLDSLRLYREPLGGTRAERQLLAGDGRFERPRAGRERSLSRNRGPKRSRIAEAQVRLPTVEPQGWGASSRRRRNPVTETRASERQKERAPAQPGCAFSTTAPSVPEDAPAAARRAFAQLATSPSAAAELKFLQLPSNRAPCSIDMLSFQISP